jgi:hypothetical protein
MDLFLTLLLIVYRFFTELVLPILLVIYCRNIYTICFLLITVFMQLLSVVIVNSRKQKN